jgi:hypothetical protein
MIAIIRIDRKSKARWTTKERDNININNITISLLNACNKKWKDASENPLLQSRVIQGIQRISRSSWLLKFFETTSIGRPASCRRLKCQKSVLPIAIGIRPNHGCCCCSTTTILLLLILLILLPFNLNSAAFCPCCKAASAIPACWRARISFSMALDFCSGNES